MALAAKDLRVALSYPVSFALGHLAAFTSIYMFYFMSRVIGPSEEFSGPDDYFRFLVIGMVVAGIIERTVSASMGAARRDQVEGTLEAVATLPVGSLTLGVGWLFYPLVDSLIGLVVAVLLALPLGMSGADPAWIPLLVALLLTTLLFASFGFFGAAIVLAFQQGQGIVGMAVTGLALISGTLFPVSVLPPVLQSLAELSPLKHALDAVRATALDHATFSEASTSLLVLAVSAAVLLPLSFAALRLGLERARRSGALGRF